MADDGGKQFEDQNLSSARFHNVDLSGAVFDWVDMTGIEIRGALLVDVEIVADISNLRINGVDVAPLIDAELNRRYPLRKKVLGPTDPAGFLEAWNILEELWAETVERARALPPEQLHESVDGEWSFIETLRHLPFATDAWLSRTVLGDPSPWHPLELPFDEMEDIPGVPRDREVRPSLDEALEVRADRQAMVRRAIESLTAERLDQMTEPVDAPGHPESKSYPVRECFNVILDEEWHHRLFAERDLDILESRAG